VQRVSSGLLLHLKARWRPRIASVICLCRIGYMLMSHRLFARKASFVSGCGRCESLLNGCSRRLQQGGYSRAVTAGRLQQGGYSRAVTAGRLQQGGYSRAVTAGRLPPAAGARRRPREPQREPQTEPQREPQREPQTEPPAAARGGMQWTGRQRPRCLTDAVYRPSSRVYIE
jgi:hypothetical protein